MVPNKGHLGTQIRAPKPSNRGIWLTLFARMMYSEAQVADDSSFILGSRYCRTLQTIRILEGTLWKPINIYKASVSQ